MGALWKLLPTVAGWIGSAVSVGKEKALAQLERQSAVATSAVGFFLVAFWFYPHVAAYIPALRESAGTGFKLLAAAPEWNYQTLILITFTVLGLGKVPKGISQRERDK